MLVRWEMYDQRGAAAGYVLRESPNGPASSGRPSRERQTESPLVDAVCRIVGFLMLAATGLLLWAMSMAA